MSEAKPKIIRRSNLSHAWAESFLSLARNEAKELAPLVLRIEGLSSQNELEDPVVRAALDQFLCSEDKNSVETVSNTIFPVSSWLRAQGDRKAFQEGYRKVYPRVIKLDAQNRNGTYFGRLIEPIPGMPEGQLEHLIQLHNAHSNVVRLKLQAAIFDASRDHSKSARPNFPCMQQVSFAPHGGNLSVNAFYALQQATYKGYGNYLGIIRLGQFMADQMGLTLDAINVFAGLATMGGVKRSSSQFSALVAAAEKSLETAPGCSS